uniref:Uncharacterized protein n=1 Tax=Ditylenchus dipsaci TaxID=166011 RepID=A0A915D3Z2_9BILA
MADVIPNGLNACHRFRNQSRNNSTSFVNGYPSSSASTASSAQSPYYAGNGVDSTQPDNNTNSASSNAITASELCKNLIQFAYHLSAAKRKTLEDPELYRTRTHSKTEERLRRKMIRNMIMEMPGKLDHASVVAYRVGAWKTRQSQQNNVAVQPSGHPNHSVNGLSTPLAVFDNQPALNGYHSHTMPRKRIEQENEHEEQQPASVRNNINCSLILKKNAQKELVTKTLVESGETAVTGRRRLNLDIPPELQSEINFSPDHSRRSPYEEQAGSFESAMEPLLLELKQEDISGRKTYNHSKSMALEAILNQTVDSPPASTTESVIRPKKKRHARGSLNRHTLGVDVTWFKDFKNLVTKSSKSSSAAQEHDPPPTTPLPIPHTNSARTESHASPYDMEPSYPNADFNTNLNETSPTKFNTQPRNSSSNNFSLRKLRGLIRQNRSGGSCASAYESVEYLNASTPSTPTSTVIPGLSGDVPPIPPHRTHVSTRV